jgi:hypothetical protein
MPPPTPTSGAARRPVTRMSQHFGQMMQECPHDVRFSAIAASGVVVVVEI